MVEWSPRDCLEFTGQTESYLVKEHTLSITASKMFLENLAEYTGWIQTLMTQKPEGPILQVLPTVRSALDKAGNLIDNEGVSALLLQVRDLTGEVIRKWLGDTGAQELSDNSNPSQTVYDKGLAEGVMDIISEVEAKERQKLEALGKGDAMSAILSEGRMHPRQIRDRDKETLRQLLEFRRSLREKSKEELSKIERQKEAIERGQKVGEAEEERLRKIASDVSDVVVKEAQIKRKLYNEMNVDIDPNKL